MKWLVIFLFGIPSVYAGGITPSFSTGQMESSSSSKTIIVETIVKVCVLLWSATLLSLSYYEPPSGKKIVDFDPTFIASIFSASTASLGFQIKKKKDTIVDNKNSKVGIK